MQPDPRVRLVIEPEDGPEQLDAVRALHAPESGRVVAAITPGGRNIDWLANDLLGALGKEEDRAGKSNAARENWRRLTAWTVGERVEHLIVAKADLLHRGEWGELTALAAHACLTLWLVSHGPGLTRGQREFTQEWPVESVTFAQLLSQWREGSGLEDVPGAGDPGRPRRAFPEVPDSDFTRFRADCYRRLTRDEFEVVDGTLRTAATKTAAWFDQTACVPTEITFKAWLRDLISDCDSLPETVTRLRGAQVAAMRRRWFVRIEVPRLVGAISGIRPAVDADVCRKLRAYTGTRHAVAALMALLADISPETISGLDLADLDEFELRLPDAVVPVPSVARGIVRSHLYARAAVGADPSDPLISDSTRSEIGGRVTPRGVRRVLNVVAREAAIVVRDEYYTQERPTEDHWLRRRGISVQAL